MTRILVVEDHPDIALLFERFLEDDGTVITRTSGFEALVRDMHAFDRIDVVVTDHHLRAKVTGSDIARVARRSGVATVILVSADVHLDPPDGVIGLTKPVTKEELRSAVLGDG